MWRLFAAVAAICIALLLWPDALSVLRWQRGAIGVEEAWRVLSAHFAHLGPWHALANLVGMALVIELLGAAAQPAEAVFIMMASALAIIAGLTLFDPAVGWYAGMSGVVHGLWAGLASLAWRQPTRERAWLPAVALASMVLKLWLWPANTGALPVVPQSHLYGAIGGAMAALVLLACSSSGAKQREFGLE